MAQSVTSRLARAASIARQRGVTTMFITMVLLLVMMLLGITAAMLGGTQFRLAGNLQLENAAFNLAEGSVGAAQVWLASGTNVSNGGFTARDTATAWWLYPIGTFTGDPTTMTWSDSNSCALTTSNACATVSAGGEDTRRYLIEKLGTNIRYPGDIETGSHGSVCIRADLFRITTRGTSAKGTTRFIQTTYSVPTPAPQCSPF